MIELLVVISIFAILAALLLPALNSAAGKGRQISCLNTISQITKGFFLYADDFDQVVLTNDAANKPWTRIMPLASVTVKSNTSDRANTAATQTFS